MSQELSVSVAIMGTIFGSIVAEFVGLAQPQGILLMVLTAVIAVSVYLYSPLPNRIGYMAGPSGAGYWGFGRKGGGEE